MVMAGGMALAAYDEVEMFVVVVFVSIRERDILIRGPMKKIKTKPVLAIEPQW